MRAEASAVLAAVLLSGCTSNQQPPAPPRPPDVRHVLFITIDTLRADRLGAYGNRDVATPNMDRLAREGALATSVSAQAPITRPSHISMFTGLYPAQHGIRDNISRALASDIPTMAEAFKSAGFDTSGFVSSIVLSAQSGLGRGFDTFSDKFDLGDTASDEARFLDILEKRGDVAAADAVGWLEGHAQQRTFTWVHLYDPHAPYEAPEPYGSKYADRPYDGEVAWSDDLVGRLDSALARLGLRDQTLTIVTSDHGEALGEHGEAVHGFFLYDATIRVPLIMRGPGIAAGTRIGATIQSVDLYPTVLNLAGVSVPTATHVAGRDLRPALRGERFDDGPAFAESLTPRLHYGWSDLRSVRDGRWKYILAPKPELYDLERDPGELQNLADTDPARVRALRTGLDRHLADEAPDQSQTPGSTSRDVPAELVQRLGALGYTSGSAPDSKSAGADPKDKVVEYRELNSLLHQGLTELRDRKYEAATTSFRNLSARGIDSFESHYYYGQAFVGLGRWREGAREFERAIPRLPGFAASYLMLAECRVALKDRPAAIDALRLGARAVPTDARLHRRLGELYRDSGDLPQSVAAFREAIARDPGEPSQWNNVGMILGATEDPAGAEQAFRAAVERDPKEARYTYNLGLTLQRAHRPDEAAGYFRKTLELNTQFKPAQDRLRELEQKK